MHKFKLYMMGETRNSESLIENLKNVLDSRFGDGYVLKIIDLLESPQLASDDKIFATPTLIQYLPAPVSKIVGDLDTKEKISVGLDLLKNF